MKKNSLLLLIALVIVFVSAQSFFKYRASKQAVGNVNYFKAFHTSAALCVPYYNPADSAKDIPALTGLGHYKWKISHAADSVQFYFNQGINMYYAFHDIEAIASFTKATHLDSTCAMAWYGKALAMGPTINYPNGYRPPSGALDAALKSKALAANCTPVEKELIEAMQHRYSADTTIAVKQLRNNYADAMQKVYERNQQNADVVTLYADALLLLHPWDLYELDFKTKPWTPKIRSLLEHALVLSPKHPGANHYYIHTMEASATPQLALKSAHLMDTLMPAVSHFTHMPSHIYIRTGDFARGIKVNDVAVAGYHASVKMYAPIANGIGLYEAHNMHLKTNCALMAGSYKIAAETSQHLKNEIPPVYLKLPGADGNYIQYIYAMPIITDVRFGKWADILKTPMVDSLAYVSALMHFARGVAYARTHQAAKAAAELKLLETCMLDKTLKAKMDNISNTAYSVLVVANWILKGTIAEDKKDNAAAIAAYTKAVAAEDGLVYNEPRDWPIPARHFLGNILLNTGKNDVAMVVYSKDLTINPNNGWTMTGQVLAYQTKGNLASAKKVQQKLKTVWAIKDLTIARSAF
jgi:tetratricopeptide (TPR) repeat protein